MIKHCPLKFLLIFGLAVGVFSPASSAHADSLAPQPPKNGFEVVAAKGLSPFSKNFATDMFSAKVIDVSESTPTVAAKVDPLPEGSAPSLPQNKKQEEAAMPSGNDGALPSGDKESSFDSSSTEYTKIRNSDRSQVLGRVDQTAPDGFLNMVYKYRKGDTAGAQEGAGQFVDYMMNLMFETRAYTKMIGEELIKRQMIDDEDWVGVEQYLDRTFAEARSANGDVLRPTHDEAMKRIEPDPKGEAEVYYFFSLGCGNYCLETSTAVERLSRVVRKDKSVKVAALSLGEKPVDWMDEYRKYTGLTVPIFDGKRIAKSLNIGFLPAVVVVAPNSGKAYLKTGEQSFDRLYEFVRRVQGIPATITPEVKAAMDATIGEKSQMSMKKIAATGEGRASLKSQVAKALAPKAVDPDSGKQAKRF